MTLLKKLPNIAFNAVQYYATNYDLPKFKRNMEKRAVYYCTQRRFQLCLDEWGANGWRLETKADWKHFYDHSARHWAEIIQRVPLCDDWQNGGVWRDVNNYIF